MQRSYTILAVLCLLGCLSAVQCKEIPPFRVRREPPPPPMSRLADPKAISTSYITQHVDNYNASNNATYEMRYMTNDQFFEKNAPILIMLGGEWTISPGFLMGGHMFEIGRDINAYLIYTEHRYYGESKPVWDTTAENLQYLTVGQALRDVIVLIEALKEKEDFAKSKVIVFGGSYAGNMATWIRLKYPEVIDGAIASSGPVLAKSDFYEYLETVNDAISEHGGPKCLSTIRDAVIEINETLNNDPETIQDLFKVCNPIDTSNELDVQTFYSSLITEPFSGLVQYARPDDIYWACLLMDIDNATAMEKLAAYITNGIGDDCFLAQYQDVLDVYGDTSYDGPAVTYRLWLYQTCTEYGYYQTTNSTNQPFGDHFPVSYFAEHACKDLYGEKFTAEFLQAGIDNINKLYGGLSPNVTRVFTVHGNIDPWHRLGIMEDLNEEAPVILINGTSHCVDLQGSSMLDIPELTAARKEIRKAVLSWI